MIMGWTQRQDSGSVRGFYRDAGGKKVARTFDSLAEAERWVEPQEAPIRAARQAARDLARPSTPPRRADMPDQPEGSVGAWAVYWFTRRTNLKAETRKFYSNQIRHGVLADPELALLPVGSLSRAQVQAWLARAERAGVHRPTLNARLKVLRMILTDAIVEGTGLTVNPTLGVRKYPTRPREGVYLNEGQCEALVEAARPSPPILLAILLGLDAGLRWEEMAAVAVSRITVRGERMSLRITHSVTRSEGLIEDTKNHRPRVVPVRTARLRDALQIAIWEAQLADRDLVLTSPFGRPLEYHNHRRRYQPVFRAAGLDGVGFHDLRHTSVSSMSDQGMPTKIIGEFHGHTDSRVTELVYMHASGERGLWRALESHDLTD